MPLTLDHIDLIAADVRASVEFYRTLGVDIPEEALWAQNGDVHHVEVVLPNGLRIGIDSIAMTKGYDPAYEHATGGRNIFIFSAPHAKRSTRHSDGWQQPVTRPTRNRSTSSGEPATRFSMTRTGTMSVS